MNELPLLIASVTLVGFSAHQLSLMQLSARVTTPFYYCLYLFLINYLQADFFKKSIKSNEIIHSVSP